MSSTGASYANLCVQQKKQKERMQRKMEERVKNGGGEINNLIVVDEGKSCRSNKVYPGNFTSPDLNGERRG